MTIVILDASSTVRTKIEDLIQDMDFDDLDTVLFDNGDDALEFISENETDLIFSSIEIEGMDGVSFIDHILRENPQRVSHLFVVTSHKGGEQLEEIKDVGAKRFITKPIKEEHFKHYIIPEITKVLNR